MKSSSAVPGLVLLVVSNAVAQVAADFDGDIILGRPTDTSISVSVMTHLDQYVYVEYGDQRGEFGARTAAMELAVEDPHVFELTGLEPDTERQTRLDGTPDNLSVWANNARKTLCSTGTTICM